MEFPARPTRVPARIGLLGALVTTIALLTAALAGPVLGAPSSATPDARAESGEDDAEKVAGCTDGLTDTGSACPTEAGEDQSPPGENEPGENEPSENEPGGDEPDPDVTPAVQVTPPTIPVEDPCGAGNATYGAIPTGDYTATRNGDGSITLTAAVGHRFPGDRPTHGYPAPVETDTSTCGEVRGPTEQPNAAEGPTEKPGEVGGVALVAYADPEGEVDAAVTPRSADGLPNTGGPSVALGLLGLGLTAAGVLLLGSRRPRRSA